MLNEPVPGQSQPDSFPKANLPPAVVIKHLQQHGIADELGLVLFEKRPINVTTPSPEEIVRVFGDGKAQKAEQHLAVLTFFLEGVPIGDKFGSNHTERKEKLKSVDTRLQELREKDPIAEKVTNQFHMFYRDQNQFRGNSLYSVLLGVQNLMRLATENGQLFSRLGAIYHELYKNFTGVDLKTKEKVGPSYYKIDSLDEKLKIVHLFEDKIVETLSLLA